MSRHVHISRRGALPWLAGLAFLAQGIGSAAAEGGADYAVLDGQGLVDEGISCISRPEHDVLLSLPVSGRIEAILVTEGGRVEKGQELLHLEREQERLEMERTRLQLVDKSALEAERSRETILKRRLDANRRLYERQQSVSEEELDRLTLEYQLSLRQRQGLEMDKQRQEIDLRMARERLVKRTLVSPIAGTVALMEMEAGESVEAYQAVARIIDTESGILVCNVEEATARLLPPGREVILRFPGEGVGEQDSSRGTVIFAAPVMDAASGLIKVKIAFRNPAGAVGCVGSGRHPPS